MDYEEYERKRKRCYYCSEMFSRSSYYRHIDECYSQYNEQENNDLESDSSSNSSFAITASDLSESDGDFKLNSGEDLATTATASGNHPG